MDIEEKLKNLFSTIKKSGNGDLTERDMADMYKLPDGCTYASWLDDIESYADGLPDDLPRVDAIRRNIPRARKALDEGNMSDLRLFMCRLDEAYTDIIRNRMGERGFIAEQAGTHPAWYTKPLIEMCRKARTPFCTAEDIFNALPGKRKLPIDKIEKEDEEVLIFYVKGRKKSKLYSLKTFRDFCTRHKILKSK